MTLWHNLLNKSITLIYNYLFLARFHRPAPIFLLVFPAYWSIAIYAKDSLNYDLVNTLYIYIAILLGGVLARSAGCVINDIADRKIDNLVGRTKNRKIANQEISLVGAIIFAMLLGSSAFLILLTFNKLTIFLGIIASILTIVYPFTKRFTDYPQVFLGITYSFGVLLGQAAVLETITLPTILLYLACILWVIGYDGIYAIQDYEFDKKLGIRSITVTFGESIQGLIGYLYLCVGSLLLIVGILIGVSFWYYIIIFLVMLHFIWQVIHTNVYRPDVASTLFNYNVYVGFLIWLACLIR